LAEGIVVGGGGGDFFGISKGEWKKYWEKAKESKRAGHSCGLKKELLA
jgi:hypothetical protein